MPAEPRFYVQDYSTVVCGSGCCTETTWYVYDNHNPSADVPDCPLEGFFNQSDAQQTADRLNAAHEAAQKQVPTTQPPATADLTISQVATLYPDCWQLPEIASQLHAAAALRQVPPQSVSAVGYRVARGAAAAVTAAYAASLSASARSAIASRSAAAACRNWSFLN